MSQRNPLSRLAIYLVFSIAIQACIPQDPQVLSIEQMQTAIAGTVQALPTQIQVPTIFPTDTQTPTETDSPTATLEPTQASSEAPAETVPALALPPCIPNPSQYEIGLVTHVVDGDTIDVQIDGQVQRVRYIGMDTPESTIQVDPFGEQATAKNRELVEGKIVTLYKDVSETDRFDRLLRFVFIDDLFINHELVQQGYATVTTYPPDVACADYYLEAQQLAATAGLGLWGVPTPTNTPLPTVTPVPTMKPAPTQPPPPQPQPTPTPKQSGNCDPSYPTVCIPPPPPDLDCGDIPYSHFKVLPPDPHRFDGNNDGEGCES